MGDTLTVLLITRVHAVSVAIAMPAHGNAECIQSALELICMAASRWAGSLIGAVGVSLITVVSTVIVSIASPVHRNAAPTVAFELVAGAGMAAASFVTVVPTVIVIVTSPVDIDAAAIVASKLGQREASWVGT